MINLRSLTLAVYDEFEDLEHLYLPNLEKLSIRIHEGNENAVINFIAKYPNLQHLTIIFGGLAPSNRNESMEYMLSIKPKLRHLHTPTIRLQRYFHLGYKNLYF